MKHIAVLFFTGLLMVLGVLDNFEHSATMYNDQIFYWVVFLALGIRLCQRAVAELNALDRQHQESAHAQGIR